MSDGIDIFGHLLQYGAAAIACIAAFYTATRANDIANKVSNAAEKASDAAKEANTVSENANAISERNLSATVELELIRFREQWLNSLRNELSNFLTLVDSFRLQNVNDVKDEDIRKLNLAKNKILLHLNPDDPNFLTFVEMATSVLANSLETTAVREDGSEVEEFSPKQLTRLCQKILKDEWEEIKEALVKYKVSKSTFKEKQC